MAIINHDYKDINFLEQIILKDDGSPLYGEIDMYRRIFRDCEASPLTWHFWHDMRLPIPVDGQAEIQIDFLLASKKGVVIVEVKGGKVGVKDGVYYLEKNGHRENLNLTPFAQASKYKNALFNNQIFDKYRIFIGTVCAFPHTSMSKTSDNVKADEGWRLWSAIQQEDKELSFTKFCESVIERDKSTRNLYKPDLSDEELNNALKTLMYNFSDDSNRAYSNVSLESIIEWLQIDNLRLFDCLKKNQRLVIEGGPGTGKTTLAKAFIKKHSDLRGLYVCWNKLLESKIKSELTNEGLGNCEVIQFASLLLSIQKKLGGTGLSLQDINTGRVEKINMLLKQYRSSTLFTPYNYIIIDEAQDILDKGAYCLLESLSFLENGVETGSFLVYYDTEQGFNNKKRNIDGWVNKISRHSAHFILDENKRVPTNKDILECAKQILKLDTNNNQEHIIDKLLQKFSNSKSINIEKFNGAKSIIKALISKCGKHEHNINNCVILAHSSTQKSDFGESLYDRLATTLGITEINEGNINSCLKGMPFTSILRYKGLESKHVYIVLNNRTYIDSYELYIGMTRAIIDINFLIME